MEQSQLSFWREESHSLGRVWGVWLRQGLLQAPLPQPTRRMVRLLLSVSGLQSGRFQALQAESSHPRVQEVALSRDTGPAFHVGGRLPCEGKAGLCPASFGDRCYLE